MSRVENLEICLSSPSHPPESSFMPSCVLALPFSSTYGPDLPSSVSLSQSLMFLKFFLKKTLALSIKNMLAFLSVMRCNPNLLYQTKCPRVLTPVS